MFEIAIWIVIGIFIGVIGGVLFISLLTGGRIEEKDYVIQDLRLQRQLLKEEIKNALLLDQTSRMTKKWMVTLLLWQMKWP